ncbi:rna polymerase sigma-70 ecf-like protein : DNA-directed RNA polymerase specialized sigma subunit, sigma24 OS=Singulisphaera acidiphila (strain ATCC BAA-1392 / DSM 18658 / VKM B-2454 / MOB10) GN=Sinac_4904 PE=4 SV=1: Sigma70_ECF [Gemmata massiliana]|uniref:RNA polymerase sigma-70 ECF-like HTH domain-containing protein n=1 Tax=Gemmata massiliana TaxID=1210884 RepID=A0A6P2CZW3_9BACT|nr:ECF-type sigma factor [Gemmata massiliana]VTR93344.1 rna polymerase sigma-70 ecf-like protein : DNA-directed RNA polymerase specialized sigma subunit, sigma24 OS=Singulisphaera acidiphila (strain ATCC BAA-1392 / DSM 18658 / VKM B-2454 / MOB10) GN=Sinac_4904 PE=4 SV=1: Sigma70_ECF [Gemmata massiliana]
MSLVPEGSITIWLEQLKGGDPSAVEPLWNRYFTKLVTLARNQLRSAPRAAADEEDVALSAFDSFCHRVAENRFPRLEDRDDLWQVLFVITTRKATGLVRREMRQKRGCGRVVHASAAGSPTQAYDALNSAVAPEPSPEFTAAIAEECELLLSLLGEGELRKVAICKMESYTNVEIAKKLGRSVATVERKLATIREIWERSINR